VEIVVTGRNVEVPEHFRVHVAEKVERLERYDHKIVGLEVELFHERNRRQLKNCQRVEITGRGCGPVARAEACVKRAEERLRADSGSAHGGGTATATAIDKERAQRALERAKNRLHVARG